ncbi:MAG: hypothetical protein ACM3O3_07755 [Syntrophothermus sp.]
MKNLLYFLIVIFFFAGCSKNDDKPLPAGVKGGEIVDKIDVPDYQYLQVEEKGEEYWIAITKNVVFNKGENVYFTKAMEMKNFKGSSIDKTFDRILFVEDASKVIPGQNPLNNPATNPHRTAVSSGKQNVSIAPIAGGKTVEQVYSMRDQLNGQTIKIKGQVTKVNSGIMDKNWIHIQDGTGDENSQNYDLLVTSNDVAEVGKTIVVEGKVTKDKDFGSGYSYPVLIEDAKIKAE